jgi:hypothetical protein
MALILPTIILSTIILSMGHTINDGSTCVVLHALNDSGLSFPLDGQHFFQSAGGVPVSGGKEPGGGMGESIAHSPAIERWTEVGRVGRVKRWCEGRVEESERSSV